MKKTIIVSMLLSVFSTAAFASNNHCTPSSYQYRVNLIVKKTVTATQKMLDNVQSLNNKMMAEFGPKEPIFRTPRHPSILKIYFGLWGAAMSVSNYQEQFATQTYWIDRDIRTLEKTCPMFDGKDVFARIMKGLNTIQPPFGVQVSIKFESLDPNVKNERITKTSPARSAYQAASYTPAAAHTGAR